MISNLSYLMTFAGNADYIIDKLNIRQEKEVAKRLFEDAEINTNLSDIYSIIYKDKIVGFLATNASEKNHNWSMDIVIKENNRHSGHASEVIDMFKYAFDSVMNDHESFISIKSVNPLMSKLLITKGFGYLGNSEEIYQNDEDAEIYVYPKRKVKEFGMIYNRLAMFGFKESAIAALLSVPILLSAFNMNNITDASSLKEELAQEMVDNSKNEYFFKFMYGIIQTESTFKSNAISKKDGGAWGLYQFRNTAIKDINRVYKTNYTKEDCFDPKTSTEMFIKYFNMLVNYYKYYNKGKLPTYKDIAMMYYGGLTAYRPSNKRHDAALRYWEDVKSNMDRLKNLSYRIAVLNKKLKNFNKEY